MNQLQNFVNGNMLVVRQNLATRLYTKHDYLHGASQNYKSIDIYGTKPNQLELKFKEKYKIIGLSGSGKYRSVKIQLTGYKLQILIVHAYVSNGKILSAWHHFHICGIINGIYHDITEFFDRDSIRMVGYYDVTIPYWTSTQKDLNGNLIINDTEMIQLQRRIQLSTTNTSTMNLRKEPNTISAIVDKIEPNTYLGCNGLVAKGEIVNGNDTWYHIDSEVDSEDNLVKKLDGWATGAFLKENGTPSLLRKLNEIEIIVNRAY